MFNRFKLLACSINPCVCFCIKKRRILLAEMPVGFYAFPINFLNMSSVNRTQLISTELL